MKSNEQSHGKRSFRFANQAEFSAFSELRNVQPKPIEARNFKGTEETANCRFTYVNQVLFQKKLQEPNPTGFS